MSIAQIIKYEGDNSTFIWKYPTEDFNSLTQLIVHESQEAIFFMNGEALDSFGPGRYTLETENIPKIGKALKLSTGSKNPFHCEVYFINKTVQMAMKWGTDSKIRFIDPDSGLPLEIGASGEMNMAVTDGRKLLVKLVGTMNGIAWNQDDSNFTKSIQESFRPLISTTVKSNLSSAIKEKEINIFEVDEHLNELSEVLKNKINPGFNEYGLTIPQLFITTILLPEEDQNFKRLRELHTVSLQKREALAAAEIAAAERIAELEKETTKTEILKREAERTMIEAQTKAAAAKLEGLAEAEIMHAQGYNKKDVLEADVQKAYAQSIGQLGANGNGGSGDSNIASTMVNLMAGMKVAGTMMDQMGGMLDDEKKDSCFCTQCGAKLPFGAKFCSQCGAKQ